MLYESSEGQQLRLQEYSSLEAGQRVQEARKKPVIRCASAAVARGLGKVQGTEQGASGPRWRGSRAFGLAQPSIDGEVERISELETPKLTLPVKGTNCGGEHWGARSG